MQNKKVKIIYFSLRDSNSREVELTCGSFFTFIGACLGFMLVLVALTLAFFTDFYQDLEISSLTKVNKHLHKQLDEMGGKLARIEKRVADLESEDDHLRIVADLPKIDDDTRDVGVGGMLDVNYELPMISDKIFDYQEVLDKMERRIELETLSAVELNTCPGAILCRASSFGRYSASSASINSPGRSVDGSLESTLPMLTLMGLTGISSRFSTTHTKIRRISAEA